MTDWNFVGARWWKFDFHAHTPASNDFKQPEMTAEDWLLGYMIAGIDCVAVTDHNSGEWIDKLKDELRDMEESEHFLYRPLHLFPGIEISAQGGVHVLAIFDPSKTSSDIEALRGAVGYKGQRGGTDRETEKSLSQVIDEITHHGGLAIPAHVDKPKGLFRLSGLALRKILEHPGVLAMELCDLDYSKPGAYRSAKTNWAEVCGSDRHDERDLGTFTWVKLGEPSIEGLRLALIDGTSSISRNMSEEPNAHADFVIEEVMINQAKFMGRPDKLVIRFSPFLTSIVGGRGTGKSTIVEFLRLALRRREELPDTLMAAMPNYFGAGEDGLLTPNASIHIIYRKGDVRYRLSWNEQEEDIPSLEEEDIETSTWEEVDGEISSLFPVSIFSQKQIFELASNPQGLLGIIDSEPQVKADSYASRYRDSVNECKQIAREITRLRGKIAQERELVGKLNDLKRRIRQLQASGHKEALQTYRLRQQQVGEIRQVSEHWSDTFAELAEALDDVGLIEVNRDAFEHHPEILDELEKYQQSALGKIRQIQDVLTQAASRPLEWRPDAAGGEWWDSLRNDVRTFRKLRDALEEQGLDPKMYEDLLQSHASIEREIQEIGSLKDRTGVLQTEYRNKLRQARKDREELTAAREAFLKGILQGSTEVKIKIRPFEQQWGGVQADVRRLLQAENRFNRDFDALSEVFSNHGWEGIKNRVRDIRIREHEPKDVRFQQHLRTLATETWVDFQLWFPEDALEITYGSDGRRLQEGSPGQKSAALLAFILSYGDAPLILDQPEDDLDNEIIYSLIVQAIRKSKKTRQVIVVTHDANIVVNGDSEYVHCLRVAKGQSLLDSDSFQSESIRNRICETMEGGREAFEQRYKRIHI